MVREPQAIEEPEALSERELYQVEEGLDSLLEKRELIAYDANIDARLEINIEEDLFVYLTIIPPRIGGRMLKWNQIREFLSREGIPHPDELIIREALKEKRFNTPILISQGRPPVNGRDARIILKVKHEQRVKEGRLLAVKSLPTKGTPGV